MTKTKKITIPATEAPGRTNKWGNLFLNSWHPYFWIALAVAALYFRTLFFDFTYLDDQALILDKLHFLKNISNIFAAFKQNVFYSASNAYYRPLLTISFMLDAHIGGASPMIYHFTNILIHAAVSCLVFVLLARLGYQRTTAFFFSLIFAVHPVMGHAAACIVSRNDSLLTLFVLAGFIFLMDYFEDRRWHKAALHILFFALALFDRENAALLPVMGVAYLLLFKRDKGVFLSLRLPAAGWLLVLTVWFFLRDAALANQIRPDLGILLKSSALAMPALTVYLGKLLLPFNLHVLPNLPDSSKVYGLVTIAIVAAFLYISARKSRRHVLFGLGWLLLFLLPTFIFSGMEVLPNFIDNRVYLPMIGFLILLMETDAVKNADFGRGLGRLTAVIVLLGLSLISLNYSGNYRDRLTFWKDAADNSPHSPLAHRNFGAMLYLAGRLDEAETEFKKSLYINAYEPMAHNNLGLIYADRNLLPEAEDEYKKELMINPKYDNVHFNLGLLYFRQGKMREAELLWLKTIELNQDYVNAYYNLAVYYYQQGKIQEAASYIRVHQAKGVPVQPEILKALNLH